MTTAADTYRQVSQARTEQDNRLRSSTFDDAFWSRRAPQFTMDPRRPLDPNSQRLGDLLQSTDVVVDVGGGAGRVSLPHASRCKEIVNVEPSAGMCAAFDESARTAGITNARSVQAGWMDDHGVMGDVTLVCNVTYFVPEIVPFVQKLVAASRRRVIISVWSVPPPDRMKRIHQMVFDEPVAPVPGHRELLGALWEIGILPDVHVLPLDFKGFTPVHISRSATLKAWINQMEIKDTSDRARILGKEFDSLFRYQEGAGLVPTFMETSREMLITWETSTGS